MIVLEDSQCEMDGEFYQSQKYGSFLGFFDYIDNKIYYGLQRK